MAWTTPATWVSGAILTAAQLNTQLRDNLNAIGAAWTSYTPTFGNVTTTGGTTAAAYIAAGKLHIVRIKFTLGAGSAVSGTPEFTLPNAVSMNAAYTGQSVLGDGVMFDASAGDAYVSFVAPVSGDLSKGRLLFQNVSGTTVRFGGATSTVPFTWASTDVFQCQFIFEAA